MQQQSSINPTDKSIFLTVEFVILLVLAGLTIYIGWVGFVASDDQYYYSAGLKWLQTSWYIPDHFGRIRFSISLPIAASLNFLGDTEFSVVLPSILYYFGILILTYWGLSRWVSRSYALLACLIWGTFPVVVTAAATASADIAELFWSVLAFWLFFYFWHYKQPRRQLLLCIGAVMAIAFSGRETVIAFALFISILAIFSRQITWQDILWIAVGGLCVFALESLYYVLAGGDPLLRFKMFFNGVSVSDDRQVVAPFSIDNTGAFRVHLTVDSLIMVTTRHLFGLGYWVFFAILFVAFKRWRGNQLQASPAADLAHLALGAGVIWFVFVAAALFRVALLGRYYIAPAWLLCIGSAAFCAVYLPNLWQKSRFKMILLLVLAVNFAGIVFENRDPRRLERDLAEIAAHSDTPIYTDPKTLYRTLELLHWQGGKPDQLQAKVPQAGELYFLIPGRAESVASSPRFKNQQGTYPVKPLGETVKVVHDTSVLPASFHGLIRSLPMIPNSIREKLISPRGQAYLIRMPVDAS